jgi:hypothetical protein
LGRLSLHHSPFFLATLLIANALALSTARAQSQATNEKFDPDAVVRGVEISRNDCAERERQETGIWVETPALGVCMRYYAAGLATKEYGNAVVTAWLNGDVLGPRGENSDKRQKGFGPSEMIAIQRKLSTRFGVPFVFVARPGTYGSAGKHHNMRGRRIEAVLVDATLDALKKRYGVQTWALGGHSGGGTLVAEMLSRRADLKCAVISSGAPAYRAYLETRGHIQLGAPLNRFDPYTSLGRIPTDPERRVFVIGDPRERNVPFAT